MHAHEIRPALLNITEREPGLFDVQWKVPALGDRSVPIQPVFPECMKPVGPPSAHAAPVTILPLAWLIGAIIGVSVAGIPALPGLSILSFVVLRLPASRFPLPAAKQFVKKEAERVNPGKVIVTRQPSP